MWSTQGWKAGTEPLFFEKNSLLMNLSLLLDPLNADEFAIRSGSGLIGQDLNIFFEKLPDFKLADIALIYVPENRGSFSNKHEDTSGHKWRKVLYKLSRIDHHTHIVDLGNLRAGPTLEDTYSRLEQLCETLLSYQTLPVVIGGSHDLSLPQYKGLAAQHDWLTIASVDSKINMEHEADSDEASSHVMKTVQLQPNKLYNYVHLAYQSFHTDMEITHLLEKLNFDHWRLGRLRDDFGRVEPIMRAADMLSFDLEAIRKSDFPALQREGFFGLTAEEACQIAWYAGLSSHIKTAGFYEYNPAMDQDGQSAYVLATLIWYFLEGYYHRKADEDFQTDHFYQFMVDMGVGHQAINFYKHKYNLRWWMEVQNAGQVRVIPCDKNDYEQAAAGQLPDAYIKALARLQ
jgi:formiminoglutamase